jgi:bifunctional non-homologous end joining protein LigD
MAFLKTYRAKRDFKKTREPRGGKPGKGRRYVIQKHAATRLHYDLRLELDGVMLSWAVTRGPSLVPGDKRLAVHVEDHPIEYNKFEGTIPKDQYGGGTVMIWDKGTWAPEGDPHFGMKKGHLDFSIDGEKLKGRFHLVRMRKRPGERQEPWLLIKSDDEFAARKGDEDILEAKPDSVVTGRSIDEIAKAGDRVWHSNRAANDQPEAKGKPRKSAGAKKPRAKESRSAGAAKKTGKASKKAKKKGSSADLSRIEGARKRAMPDFVEPSLATLSAKAPDSAGWLHEIKFDGYRMQARIAGGKVSLRTRTGLDWTARFPSIARALGEIPGDAILDGEIVSQERGGVSDFSALQEDLKAGRQDRMAYYVFDLLHRDGFDLTGAPLLQRKQALAGLMGRVPDGLPIHLSEAFETSGPNLLKHACKMNLEGIISKRANARYRGGRVGDWLKTKCTANQEFVIAGYEPSGTVSRSIRALILGYFEEGELRYAGRVGTGFKVSVEHELLKKLAALKSEKMPFRAQPEEESRRKVRWVTPKLVAEIDFRGWTHGDVLRQASFKGLREDKSARDVVREMPKIAAAAQKTPSMKSKAAPRKLTTQKTNKVEVAGVVLSHPDRVYWKDGGVTKAMLADYYRQVWKWMAPHVVDRPIALVRCPDGAAAKCFFQKHVSAGIEGERLVSVPLKGEQPAIALDDLSGLIALAQAGVLEIHCWGTHRQHVETCDFLVFDLDPGPGITLKQLIEAARDVRARLAKMKLKSFVKTTGGKGLHVVLPIAPADWDAAKDFAHGIADAMEADNPQRYVANMAKKKRENRIFVDYLRNGRGATAIAPYSTRARPGAPVAVPLSWEELGSLKAPNQFTVLNVPKRLARLKRDPWAGIGKIKQKLPR